MPFAPIRSGCSAAKHTLDALTGHGGVEPRDSLPGLRVPSAHPGVVATERGPNARHGGPDSRSMPGVPRVAEVACVVADALERPRADGYPRGGAHELVAGYDGAPGTGEAEHRPPLVRPRESPGTAQRSPRVVVFVQTL